MSRQIKMKEVFYHETSEKIFRQKGAEIATIVNSIKPMLESLGFLENISFTDVLLDLFNNKYDKIDEDISVKIKASGGGIKYVEDQLYKEYSEQKRRAANLILNLKDTLERLKTKHSIGNYDYHTLDYDECLNLNFLSIDQKNDLFVLDESAVERVKSRFTISFSGENLKVYDAFVEAVKNLNAIADSCLKAGIDLFYFDPLAFIEYDDSNNRRVYSLDVLGLNGGLDFCKK